MTTVWDINLFYPLTILAVIVLIVTIGLVIKGRSSDFTFKDIFFKNSTDNKEIFFRHSEEHENTTSKMAQMHDNVIKVDFTDKHEGEMDSLEKGLRDLDNRVKNLKSEVDKLITRVIELENNR